MTVLQEREALTAIAKPAPTDVPAPLPVCAPVDLPAELRPRDTTDNDRFLAALERLRDLPPEPPCTPDQQAANEAILANARLAVEWDPVRVGDRLQDLRLAAAVTLAPRVEICEALLAGVPVPAERLDKEAVRQLRLVGDVVLDEELALRVVAAGPRLIEPADTGKAAA